MTVGDAGRFFGGRVREMRGKQLSVAVRDSTSAQIGSESLSDEMRPTVLGRTADGNRNAGRCSGIPSQHRKETNNGQ